MKGKNKKKKVGKIILLAMSFIMTVVVTFSVTLAWFYDSDWANKTITMAGAVGIHMEDTAGKATHGAGNFYFKLADPETNPYAYPGQAIEVQAKVFNDGGDSIINYFSGKTYNNDSSSYNNSSNYNNTDIAGTTNVGSPCYVRARFVVYTDIGQVMTKAQAYAKWPQVLDSSWSTDTNEIPDSFTPTVPTAPNFNTASQSEKTAYYTKMTQYKELNEYLENRKMSAQELYEALVDMVDSANANANDGGTPGYNWVFWENDSAAMTLDGKTYFEGKQQSGTRDGGYFYLCYETADASKNILANKTLKPLNVGDAAAFLWNGTFVIPWQLTNLSADKTIFVAVEFQAIQTYIPLIAGGTINSRADNQLPAGYCYYDDISVQTIFNSSRFTNYEELTTDASGIVYSAPNSKYTKASITTVSSDPGSGKTYLRHGTAQANAYTPA